MKYIITVFFLLFSMIAYTDTNTDYVIYISYDDALPEGWQDKIRDAYAEQRVGVDPTNHPDLNMHFVSMTNLSGHKIWTTAEWNSFLMGQGCTGLYTKITAKVPKPHLNLICVTNASFYDRGYIP
jgi:hypothetical protein